MLLLRFRAATWPVPMGEPKEHPLSVFLRVLPVEAALAAGKDITLLRDPHRGGTVFGVPSWATDWSLYRDPGMGLGAGRGPAISNLPAGFRKIPAFGRQVALKLPAGKSEHTEP